VRKSVNELFEAFATAQQPSMMTQPLKALSPQGPAAAKQRFAAAIPSPSDPTGVVSLTGLDKLPPTRKGFESVLRVYHRHAGADEIEAMLSSVTAPLEALARGRWAAQAQAEFGGAIKRAFAKADKDGSGGIVRSPSRPYRSAFLPAYPSALSARREPCLPLLCM
jgi:hypothetical protein